MPLIGFEPTPQRRISFVVQSYNHYTTGDNMLMIICSSNLNSIYYFLFANGVHCKNKIISFLFSNPFYSKTMGDQGFWLGWDVNLFPWKIFMFNDPERGCARNAILIHLKLLFLWCKLSPVMKNSPKCKFSIMNMNFFNTQI